MAKASKHEHPAVGRKDRVRGAVGRRNLVDLAAVCRGHVDPPLRSTSRADKGDASTISGPTWLPFHRHNPISKRHFVPSLRKRLRFGAGWADGAQGEERGAVLGSALRAFLAEELDEG